MIGHIVRELVLCLENNMKLSNFSKNEIQSFIDSIFGNASLGKDSFWSHLQGRPPTGSNLY